MLGEGEPTGKTIERIVTAGAGKSAMVAAVRLEVAAFYAELDVEDAAENEEEGKEG
jgi:hypothetical protein